MVEKKEKETFNILFCKGWNPTKGDADRGNFPFLLKAFAKAFAKEDNVILTAKFNAAYIPQGANLAEALAKI